MTTDIIIPVKLQARHLIHAAMSAIMQMGSEDKIYIVDDNDDSPAGIEDRAKICLIEEKLREFLDSHDISDSRLIVINSSNGYHGSKGVSAARNFAATLSDADWLKFLDADDQLVPFALNSFRSLELDEDIHLASGNIIQVIDGLFGKTMSPNFNLINRMNPTLVSNSFIRRAAFEQVGKFNEALEFEEDWDLWLRLRKLYGMQCFATVEFPVCFYQIINSERAAKVRKNTVSVPDTTQPRLDEGGFRMINIDVREYFKRAYGVIAA